MSSLREIEDAGITITKPGEHGKPPERGPKGKKTKKPPEMKGVYTVFLGGDRQGISLGDLEVLKRVCEPHGGLKVLSYDPEDKTFMVQAKVDAIGAIQAKSSDDQASREAQERR
jgi:hypothetical protein